MHKEVKVLFLASIELMAAAEARDKAWLLAYSSFRTVLPSKLSQNFRTSSLSNFRCLRIVSEHNLASFDLNRLQMSSRPCDEDPLPQAITYAEKMRDLFIILSAYKRSDMLIRTSELSVKSMNEVQLQLEINNDPRIIEIE